MKAILISYLILVYVNSSAQSWTKEFILKNSYPIASISPHATNFSDLEVIKKAIGNKRIVMLGELYHGDGTVFQAKTRLVKFLHEELNFNVLAFEGDFFSLNYGWEMFRNGNISFDSLTYLSIYPLWTGCVQFTPLLSYISNQPKNRNDLILTGIDNRGYSGFSLRYLIKALNTFLKARGIPLTMDDSAYSQYYNLLKEAPVLIQGKNKKGIDKLIGYTKRILAELNEQIIEDDFYIKVLQGQLQLFNMAIYYKYDSVYAKNKKNYPQHDFQMAENLKWLAASKYANEKIIVWAHNTHIEKGAAANTRHNDYNSMGYLFTRDSSMYNQSFIIGFTSYSGNGKLVLGDVSSQHVTKPKKNSIEYWMHKLDYPYSFVDFTTLNNSNRGPESFYMKSYINASEKLNWNRYYDAVFFIDSMMPCDRIKE